MDLLLRAPILVQDLVSQAQVLEAHILVLLNPLQDSQAPVLLLTLTLARLSHLHPAIHIQLHLANPIL